MIIDYVPLKLTIFDDYNHLMRGFRNELVAWFGPDVHFATSGASIFMLIESKFKCKSGPITWVGIKIQPLDYVLL